MKSWNFIHKIVFFSQRIRCQTSTPSQKRRREVSQGVESRSGLFISHKSPPPSFIVAATRKLIISKKKKKDLCAPTPDTVTLSVQAAPASLSHARANTSSALRSLHGEFLQPRRKRQQSRRKRSKEETEKEGEKQEPFVLLLSVIKSLKVKFKRCKIETNEISKYCHQLEGGELKSKNAAFSV